MSAPYTDEEIEQHLDELDMLGPNAAYLDTGSAAIIRQLRAERRASEKERDDAATPEDSSAVRDTMTVAEAEAWATRAAEIAAVGAAAKRATYSADGDRLYSPTAAVKEAVARLDPLRKIAHDAALSLRYCKEIAAAAVARARGERK